MTEENFQSRPKNGGLRLFIVRHGETDANRDHLLQGTSNGKLNDTGKWQADRLGRHLQKCVLDRVYTSDLQRAVDTGRAVARWHGLEVEQDSRLREWEVGELDGQPAAIYLRLIRESGKPLSQFDPPGGQKLAEVRRRADEVVGQLVAGHPGESVLVCSHGDFMRQMVGSMLEIDVDTATAFHFDNASYSVFEYRDQRWTVVAINRIAAACETGKEESS